MGKERDFVDLDTISRHLFCPICFDVFSQPTRIRCGHTFCQGCVQTWAKKALTCPQCRERFSLKTCSKDLLADRLVTELRVKCGHEGCSWVGQLGSAEAHAKACVFHPDKVAAWLKAGLDKKTVGGLLLKVYEKDPNLARALAYPQPPALPLNDPDSAKSQYTKRAKLDRL
jgi:hypothetical protein